MTIDSLMLDIDRADNGVMTIPRNHYVGMISLMTATWEQDAEEMEAGFITVA